jgi:hypothetical protein
VTDPTLYRGSIPRHVLEHALDDADDSNDLVDVLVTLWPDGSGQVALRSYDRWGIPTDIEETQ